jgi:5'-3' exonuclease
MEMMHPFVEGLDWLLSFYVNARGWFWLRGGHRH